MAVDKSSHLVKLGALDAPSIHTTESLCSWIRTAMSDSSSLWNSSANRDYSRGVPSHSIPVVMNVAPSGVPRFGSTTTIIET